MTTGSNEAKFLIESPASEIPVHFQPSSLQMTISNKLQQGRRREGAGRRGNNSAQQVVKESVAKLTFELIFDTTDTGENVCAVTERVAKLMGEKGKAPPKVTFDWGAFRFTGIVDTYRETVEFFSSDGVPLRSTVSIGMTQDENTYDRGDDSARAGAWSGAASPGDSSGPVETPPRPSSELASAAGNPAAARDIAAQNGQESLRFSAGASLVLDASVSLSPPVAFATGELSLGAGAGLSLSAGAGVSMGASAGFSAGAGVSAGVGMGASAGFSASAGVSAGVSTSGTMSAFSELHSSAKVSVSSMPPLDPSRVLLGAEAQVTVVDDRTTVFDISGRAVGGSESRTRLQSRIRFGEE